MEGKPSSGRKPPPLRPQSKIAPLAQSCAQEVQMSINRGDRKHPFPQEFLQRTRQHIAQAIGLNLNATEEVAPGQPFYLNLISALAEAGGDADALYPKDIATGVPLGVTTPTWTSPGIWPTKEELKVKRRISTVERPPPANGQGQLFLCQRFLIPGQADLC